MKLWNILMGADEEQREGGRIRFLFAVVMIAGIAISGYGLYKKFNYTQQVSLPPETTIDAEADKERLAAMISDIKSIIAARADSIKLAPVSSVRYPFGSPVYKESGVLAVQQPAGGQNLSVEEYIEPSPYVLLRGVLRLDKDVVAMLDIEGEPNGKIYRIGSPFADKEGRIIKIEKNSVTVRYKGKDFIFTN